MDKTIRTIRNEIGKDREGVIPTLTLIVDTNILADYAWARDNNVIYLIEEIAPDFSEFLIIVPQICEVEFKLITKEEVNAWKNLQQLIQKKNKDLQRYDGFNELHNRLQNDLDGLNELIIKLKEATVKEVEILSKLMLLFRVSLPLHFEDSFYISKNPEYGLLFEDALVFSFVKLVGKAIRNESNVLFLTKDSDFDIENVLKELNEVGVEVYFNSGVCLQRIKNFLEIG
jgi:hypothetical protein